MLVLQNISVALGKGTKLQRQILQNLNLSVAKGEFVVILGENGSGKSTLFNVISGFLSPDQGRIILEGNDITKNSHAKRANLISKVMQDPKIGTIANMTILENMSLAFKRGQKRRFLPFITKKRRDFFSEKLSLLNMGLEKRLDFLVSDLSGGQRQAISLIMSILADSKVLLLDEITAALDPKSSKIVINLANEIIRKEKLTCIMITHDMKQARDFGDRTILLKDGKLKNI